MSDRPMYDFLVVDDERYICQLLQRWIIEAGYSCRTADSGAMALQGLEDFLISVVITDIRMPVVSGIDILTHVQRTHEYTPVIMMTGNDDQELIKKAYSLGAYGYMNKPLNHNEVLSNLLNALRRRELEIENRKHRESLEEIIDTRAREIEGALASISAIMAKVIAQEDFHIRFENHRLPKCYVEMNCQKRECPCFGKVNNRCWQIAGTFCEEKPQGRFSEKYGRCSKCPVFKMATREYSQEIGEHFNNMMNMLATKHHDLEEAYEKQKTSQQRAIQQEKMATIGQLAAGIAHEINNPVGYVTSNLNSLQNYCRKLGEFIAIQGEALSAYGQGDPPMDVTAEKKRLKIQYILDDIEELFRESVDGCGRIRTIVGDLKSFARTDDDTPKGAAINEIMDKAINVVWNEIKYKARIIKRYGELPVTTCHANKLSQVFMNLLVNAAHAMEEQGTITITTGVENGYIVVSLEDSGCGIPPEHLETVFEPFFTTKEEGRGTGLGLSICKEIMAQHAGEISVASTVGKGTTFTIRLPVR